MTDVGGFAAAVNGKSHHQRIIFLILSKSEVFHSQRPGLLSFLRKMARTFLGSRLHAADSSFIPKVAEFDLGNLELTFAFGAVDDVGALGVLVACEARRAARPLRLGVAS